MSEKVEPFPPGLADVAPPDLLPGESNAVLVEVGVHDISRFEWRVGIPVPSHGRSEYTVDAEFELPSNAVSSRSPWDQLQGLTRLEGIHSIPASSSAAETTEAVRRRVLALQQMLRRAKEGVIRHCRLVFEPEGKNKNEEAVQFLSTWLDTALRALTVARAHLTEGKEGDSPEVRRERELADEYISVGWLDFLAETRATLETTLCPLADEDERFSSLWTSVDERLARALDAELCYRRSKGYPIADAASPPSLETYVERSGWLKKHFQALLVLDREVVQVDDRVRVWFAVFAAVLAGACAFALQLAFVPYRVTGPMWSLIGLALIMGGTYAMRERIKELARAWLTGRVYRFYAQRVVRCRLPTGTTPTRDIVAEAREWCNEMTTARPDPVDPEGGASRRATLVNHVHRGFVRSHPQLALARVGSIRQIFRYDLSPMFPTLHDPVKRIPVLDPETGRSRFVDAPRRYQIPFRVRVKWEGHWRELGATIVMDKQGIVRMEREPRIRPATLAPAR
jgi:hypothetical protein